MIAAPALFTLALALLMGPAAGTALSPVGQAQGQALEARKWLCNIMQNEGAEACKQQYHGSYPPGSRNDKCDGWYCNVDGSQRGLNMDMYCTDRYGSNTYASCDKSLWDWQCHDRS